MCDCLTSACSLASPRITWGSLVAGRGAQSPPSGGAQATRSETPRGAAPTARLFLYSVWKAHWVVLSGRLSYALWRRLWCPSGGAPHLAVAVADAIAPHHCQRVRSTAWRGRKRRRFRSHGQRRQPGKCRHSRLLLGFAAPRPVLRTSGSEHRHGQGGRERWRWTGERRW